MLLEQRLMYKAEIGAIAKSLPLLRRKAHKWLVRLPFVLLFF